MELRHPDKQLLALGIRQPWAELILRGIKTIEVRSQDTRVRGPIYVYASKKPAVSPAAAAALARYDLDLTELPVGVLVGTVEIVETALCRTAADAAAACVSREAVHGRYGWRLANPVRLETPLLPHFLPYGVWFYPFRRRHRGTRR